jgi:3-hydroxyisobutyrate dehydrogenase-like beta-hydroxyacid dehydrogenase
VGAENGTLSIMVGGDEDALRSVAPAFEFMGSTIRHMGSGGSGALAKACNQIVVAGTVTAVSEAMLLARGGGLDPSVMLELLRGGLADSEVLRQKGHRLIDGDFAGGGSAQNQLKDLNFVLGAAGTAQLELPLSTVIKDLFEDMVARGDGGLDHTGIFLTLAQRNSALTET